MSKSTTTEKYVPKLKDSARVLATYGDLSPEAREKYERPAVIQMERARAMREIARPKGRPVTMTPAAPSEAEALGGAMVVVKEEPKAPSAHKATKVGPEVVAADPPEVGLTDSLDTEGRVHFGEIEDKPRPERRSY
jgi:hypothetical protein